MSSRTTKITLIFLMLLLNQVSKAQVYCIPPDVSRSWSEERSRLGLLSSSQPYWLNSPVKLLE